MEANAKITRLSEHNAEMEKRSVCLEKVQRERDIFEKSATELKVSKSSNCYI